MSAPTQVAPDSVQIVLDGAASEALRDIVQLLGPQATQKEAIRRALGTELYLLKRVVQEKATVLIRSRTGKNEEVVLTG